MKTKSVKKAIIIGGGIAGPATALFLKMIGVESEIFESNPINENLGAGLNLAANGMNVLAHINLASKVITAGSIPVNGIMKNKKGKRLAKFKYSNVGKYKYPNVNISRPVFNRILVDELKANSISIHYEKKLVKIIQTPDFVEAHFTDGSVSKADILIGADGVGSQVRTFVLENQVTPSFTGLIGSGGFLAKNKIPLLNKAEPDDLNFIYGANGFFGYSSVSHDEIMWWTNIIADKPFPRESLKNIDNDSERKILLKQYGKYSSPVPEIIENCEKFVRVNVFDIQNLPKWSKNRIVLIGDAAHAVSPNSGQGASMALEDAMLLVKLLRDELTYEKAFEKI